MQLSDYKFYQHGVIFRGAPHDEKELSPAECSQLMSFYKGLFVRNVFDWDCNGPTSFGMLYKTSLSYLKNYTQNAETKSGNLIKH